MPACFSPISYPCTGHIGATYYKSNSRLSWMIEKHMVLHRKLNCYHGKCLALSSLEAGKSESQWWFQGFQTGDDSPWYQPNSNQRWNKKQAEQIYEQCIEIS